jgi:ATP/maltotriose-dependent transcriptional regulator MalT
MRLAAHHALWLVRFFRGEFAAALRHIDEGESLCDPGEDSRSALVYVHDPKTDALSYRAFVLWQLGRVDQALETSRQALAHARALGHPLSLGGALHCAARIRFLRGELEASRELAEALNVHAREHDLPHWEAYGLQLHGSVIAEQGELEHGAAEIEKGLALAEAIGNRPALSAYWPNLVAARMRAGHLAEARADLERCKELLALGERLQEAEIRRLDAELVLAEAGGERHAPPEARERARVLVEAAIECARRQGARTLELRAATSLARLSGRGAKGSRARLAELLASFTEGFDTADLKEARQALSLTRTAAS